MLTRAITGFALLAIFIPLFLMGGTAVYFMAIAVGAMALYEVTSLREKYIPKLVRIFTIVAYTAAFFLDIKYWAMAIFVILFLLVIIAEWNENLAIDDVFMLATVCTTISFAGYSFKNIGLADNMYLFIIAIITFGNDTGAYFAGCFFGKHKFNERVSPKKTWEGAIGGFLASYLSALIINFIYPVAFGSFLNANVVGVVLGITGPMGDLMFSLIKRHYNVKDYGSLLPGHGGVLDRIDSLLINFAVFMVLLECVL